MADYNIYLHATEIGGQMNPTTPWGQQGQTNPTTPWGQQSGDSSFKDVLNNSMATPDSLVARAWNTVKAYVPAVAVAAWVVKQGVQLYENVVDISTMVSGDYGRQTKIDNFKVLARNVLTFRPIGTSVEAFKNSIQIEIKNAKQRENRELLGDSVINAYTNRGV